MSVHRPWEPKAACADAVLKQPYMAGAWDGPNEDGDRHPFEGTAKKICLGCPVRNQSLQDALNDPESQGLRGGYEFDGGKISVGSAREIRDTLGLKTSSWQALGRPKTRRGEEA